MSDKTVLVHNIPSPYRLPLFEELSHQTNLKVFFLKKGDSSRKWNPSLEDYSFRYNFLPLLNLRALWINPTFPLEILKEKPDRIIIGEYFFNIPSIVLAVLYTKMSGSDLILWSGVLETEYSKSDRGFIRNLYSRVRNSYQKVLYRFTDSYIAYCKEAKKYLLERGAKEEDINIGGQVMPQELLPESKVSKSDTKYNDEYVILSLGYLQKRKGIKYLIKAFKHLEVEDKRLIIAGSGPDEERLRDMAGENENIGFVGHVKGKEKAKFYSIADLFVLPTLHDPWGLVVNEALYYNNPVIVTESAGAKDIIQEGKNGKVIPPANKEAIKEALDRAIENQEDFDIKETGTDVEQGLIPFKNIIGDK